MYITVSERAYHVLKGTAQSKYFRSSKVASKIRAVFSRTDTIVKYKLSDSVTDIIIAKFDARTLEFLKHERKAKCKIALTTKTYSLIGVKTTKHAIRK